MPNGKIQEAPGAQAPGALNKLWLFTFKKSSLAGLNIPLGFFYLFTFLLFYLYKVQLVTPSVVAMAVRTEIAICKIVFQVFAFIIFILMLTFLMLNVEC